MKILRVSFNPPLQRIRVMSTWAYAPYYLGRLAGQDHAAQPAVSLRPAFPKGAVKAHTALVGFYRLPAQLLRLFQRVQTTPFQLSTAALVCNTLTTVTGLQEEGRLMILTS